MMQFLVASAVAVSALSAPQHFVLQSEHNIWDKTFEDFDANGQMDILLLSSDEKSDPLTRSISVYLANHDGTYPSAPTFTIPLNPESGAFFLAEVDGAAPREIIKADAEGAEVLTFNPAETAGFSVVSESAFDSLLPSATREPAFLKGAAQDLDGDGVDEWLLPLPTGYVIRRADKEVARVRCDVNSVISQDTEDSNVYIRHRLPDVSPFGGADDSFKGLAFLSDEFADFAHGPAWGERWRFDIPLRVEDKWDSNARMADVDQSGFPDLVVTQTRGSINMEGITQIYVAEEAFKYPDEPTAKFESKGAVEAPILIDVDGDGDRDVLVISVPFGVKNLVNYFVRGKISINANVYEFADGKFSDEPVFKESLTFEAPDGRERIAYAMSDFTGDGRLDLAFSSGPDKIVVHAGETEDFLSRRPVHEIRAPSFGIATAHDLRGDGSDDIVIIHPTGKESKRAEVIVFE